MTVLLILIYITFISLGLPDSLFGVAWPLMHLDLGQKESFASIVMILVAVGSGGTSFMAGMVVRKFGTGLVTFVSVLLTAVGMFGISLAPNIWVVILCSIILGIGAGAVDAGLNSFVAKNYKSRQMNWLHCFWGVGVSASPLIMSVFLANGSWRGGYRAISLIQFGIAFILLCSLPLWKKRETRLPDKIETAEKKKKINPFKIKGVIFALLSFGFYCGMEFTIGTWGATYIVHTKLLSPEIAAKWVSLYFGGIMVGRFLSGLFSEKLNDKILIRLGVIVSSVGMLVLALPVGELSLIGLLLIGIGFGPIFPCSLHATPDRFGEERAADIIGFQMGCGYGIGFAVQLSFGYIATHWTFVIMPFVLLALSIVLLAVTETINSKTKISSENRVDII